MIDFQHYAHLLQAIGEGRIVQRRDGEFWEDAEPSAILRDIAIGTPVDNFRCKPRAKTMGIPGGPGRALPEDPFKGDNAQLIQCMQAALDLDLDGCLQEPLGSFGRQLLLSALMRLSARPIPARMPRHVVDAVMVVVDPFLDMKRVRRYEVLCDNVYSAIQSSIEAAPAPLAAASAVQNSLDAQVKNAQAEMASWPPEKRASMRLQGFDSHQGDRA